MNIPHSNAGLRDFPRFPHDFPQNCEKRRREDVFSVKIAVRTVIEKQYISGNERIQPCSGVNSAGGRRCIYSAKRTPAAFWHGCAECGANTRKAVFT